MGRAQGIVNYNVRIGWTGSWHTGRTANRIRCEEGVACVDRVSPRRVPRCATGDVPFMADTSVRKAGILRRRFPPCESYLRQGLVAFYAVFGRIYRLCRFSRVYGLFCL